MSAYGELQLDYFDHDILTSLHLRDTMKMNYKQKGF